jgi:peptide/nickel transport system ATP-binding protein
MADPVLQLRGLRKTFTRNGHTVAALDGVDLDVPPGTTVALAGASGSGKSTLARCVMRLTTPDAGTIHLAGTDLLALPEPALRALRPRFQMVFQDPSAAFNPRATVLRALSDPLRLHNLAPRHEWRDRALALLDMVRLPPDLIDRRPHELSGGQRQRVAIARALASNPSLVVLDEPVSALDVSVRNAVLNLLQDLQDRTGVAYLLISHDLAVVRAIARTVAIMESGRIVEHGPVAEVFAHPSTETTRRLLAAVPRLSLA